ncbi:MAG TPA: FtsQ-type POTRA domain-containing protein [Acidimicrobiia bacterium]|nr:FtsQ-type POTRA domain-containing protein [Acidimicrobiia bacterium]
MDRRLAERRRRVAEDRARSNLGRLVRLLTFLVVVAAVVWFLQSPFVSVGEITVQGANRVDVTAVLGDHGVVEGRPLLVLDVAGAEESLLSDPWVAQASVARDWPTRVVVQIEERVPAVAARLKGGWWLVAGDATLLEPVESPPSNLPRANLPDLNAKDSADGLELAGAVEFLGGLPAHHQPGAEVRLGAEGLEATVSGFRVRIGRPFDTAEKAVVAAAMIDSGLEEGGVITVVAPASPAVLPPEATQK